MNQTTEKPEANATVTLIAFGAMMVATNVFNDALAVDLDGYLSPYAAR